MNLKKIHRVDDEKPMHTSAIYFPALTGLRALVAWLVFFYHASSSFSNPNYSLPAKVFFLLIKQGDIGVSIFFMLSGFLITIRYQKNIELTSIWFRRYLQNRFARIYPIYFLLTALTFAVMIMRPSYNWYQWPTTFSIYDKLAAIGLNLTLTRAFFQKMVFLGVPTAWSLTVEESFYLLAPFLLLGLRMNARRLWLYPVVSLTLGALLVLLCANFLPYYGLMASLNFMLVFTFFGRCLDFVVGIWLGLNFNPAKAGKWCGGKSTLLGVGGLMLLMLSLSVLAPAMKEEAAGRLLLNTLFTIPTALLLRGLITEKTWLQYLLQLKVFDLLGKSSYIFYLIHLGIIDTIFIRFVTDNWLARLVAYNLFSIGLYLLIEHPMHNLLRAKKVSEPVKLKKGEAPSYAPGL